VLPCCVLLPRHTDTHRSGRAAAQAYRQTPLWTAANLPHECTPRNSRTLDVDGIVLSTKHACAAARPSLLREVRRVWHLAFFVIFFIFLFLLFFIFHFCLRLEEGTLRK